MEVVESAYYYWLLRGRFLCCISRWGLEPQPGARRRNRGANDTRVWVVCRSALSAQEKGSKFFSTLNVGSLSAQLASENWGTDGMLPGLVERIFPWLNVPFVNGFEGWAQILAHQFTLSGL